MAEILTQTAPIGNHDLAQIGSLAAKFTVLVHRVDALEERIGVVRALVDAVLNSPHPPMPPFAGPPMPGVQYPPPPFSPGLPFPPPPGGLEYWRLQQDNLAMTRQLQQIIKILTEQDSSLKEEGHESRPGLRDPKSA